MDLNLSLNSSNSASSNKTVSTEVLYDHLIIGGGPAGMNGALYAKRKGLEVGILAKGIGGQLLNTHLVENYLGLNNTSGEELTEDFRAHIDSLEIPVSEGVEVTGITKSDDVFYIETDSDKSYKAKTLLLATGTESRKIGVKGEVEYAGRGVSYCAICDATFFKNRDVVILGGGNSAVEAAIDLAKLASSVTIVQRSQFRADEILVKQLYTNDKITVHLETQILEILGDQFVTGVKVLDKTSGETKLLKTDGVFVEIGNIPNSQLFKDLVDLNELGEVIVNRKNETSTPGIYAAGDITDGPFKQIIVATSDGARAALSANEYLNQLAGLEKKQTSKQLQHNELFTNN